MKIAFISYEYPPDTACGGIATYVRQAVSMLSNKGHYIEVFSGSFNENKIQKDNQVIIHRIKASKRQEFTKQVGTIFAQRYQQIKFDVLEAPEIGAEAAEAIKLVPEIPLVVKLHTPSYVLQELFYTPPSFQMKLRRYFGALRRGNIPKPFHNYSYNPDNDLERIYTLKADEITAPSLAIANKLNIDWQVDKQKVIHLPNPYIPSQKLLDIPIKTQTNIITFIGRLEIRKGILDLAKAIPLILNKEPKTKFRFVGSSLPSPNPKLDMHQYLEKKLKLFLPSLEFIGNLPLEKIPSILAETDICVFPSIWENFPYVCLEAMSAGRGIVGSSAGGMAELLDGGKVGKLVPPKSPKSIAKAVIELLQNPEERMKLGEAARQRVLSQYNLERIGALQEASYLRAIEKRQALGARNIAELPQPIYIQT
ncbi:glycosyl transferase group 1 [Stanieria cyanosphaera PCC 7437]|uniref:Glycosyl transferase group 1 n=2 Tax=Stanieria cyanosphaera TaxID=102116 RepID=K9XU65_STAC7|nr:glycosyl transferase group 1 [Stanieria cyanosphaera PCC 7437]